MICQQTRFCILANKPMLIIDYQLTDNTTCDICMRKEETLKDKVVEEMLAYNRKFQVEMFLIYS